VAGRSFAVSQSAAAEGVACTTATPTAPQVAREGRTELIADFSITCSGISAPILTDVLLRLNTNITNAVTTAGSDLTDALLSVNGSTPQKGKVVGYNSLRWVGVPLAPGSDGKAA